MPKFKKDRILSTVQTSIDNNLRKLARKGNPEAISKLRKLALDGNAEAQFVLGSSYYELWKRSKGTSSLLRLAKERLISAKKGGYTEKDTDHMLEEIEKIEEAENENYQGKGKNVQSFNNLESEGKGKEKVIHENDSNEDEVYEDDDENEEMEEEDEDEDVNYTTSYDATLIDDATFIDDATEEYLTQLIIEGDGQALLYFKNLEMLAEEGNTKAQVQLGIICHNLEEFYFNNLQHLGYEIKNEKDKEEEKEKEKEVPVRSPYSPNMNHLTGVMFPAVKEKVDQSMLTGQDKSKGRISYFGDEVGLSTAKTYTTATGTVHAFLKINGKAYLHSYNGKAGDEIIFRDMGITNQRGVKDNPHAEDWIFASFHHEVENVANLDEYIDKQIALKSSNTNWPDKHLFSLRINFSPCLGCVASIIAFKGFLEEKLGEANFILRVKFLRPYDVSVALRNPSSKKAQNFEAAIKRLFTAGIPVRLQPLRSAQAMNSEITKKELKNEHVSKIFKTESMQWLYKTWPEWAYKTWEGYNVARKKERKVRN